MEPIRIEAHPAQLRVVFPRWSRARRPLLWLAAALADALSARALVLTRLADGTVAAGGATGWPPAAYTVAVARHSRRLGRAVHRLTLTARREVGSATVDLGLLDLRIPREEDARALAAALERFIRGA